ncbi:MAG: FMN-binding protein [Eubacteriales bacterium]|nr:FMN-binding protein [Eubacteriales bacterium]
MGSISYSYADTESNSSLEGARDGYYTGTGQGRDPKQIELGVRIKDGKISSIVVLVQNETAFGADWWEKNREFFHRILDKQSTDPNEVQAITGASKSSEGIRAAVNVCLDKARRNAPDIDRVNSDFSVFDGGGRGTKENPYIIKSKSSLLKLADSVNVDEYTYADQYIKLEDDIDLSDMEWTPIGNEYHEFRGIFDGDGHTISGLKIGSKDKKVKVTDESASEGLFGCLGTGAKVENLTLRDAEMNVSGSHSLSAGIIAGSGKLSKDPEGYEYYSIETDAVKKVNGAVIDRCSASGDVRADAGDYAAVGGIIGSNTYASIINCFGDTSVTSLSYGTFADAGGIAGFNDDLIANSASVSKIRVEDSNEDGRAQAGLVTGRNNGTVVNCFVKGDIDSASEPAAVGLTVGWQDSGNIDHVLYDKGSAVTIAGKAYAAEPVGLAERKEAVKDAATADADTARNAAVLDGYLDKAIETAKAINVNIESLSKWQYTGDGCPLPVEYKLGKIDISKCKISGLKDQVYSGKSLKPAVKVTYHGEEADVKVTYKNNKNIGLAKVTITGAGKFSGESTKTFKILTAKSKIKKAKAAKKSVKLTVSKLKGGVKYQVSYKNGKKWKTVKSSKTKVTVKKLKSGKKYNFRVRAYKKVGGKTYYGSWSKTKTVKVK